MNRNKLFAAILMMAMVSLIGCWDDSAPNGNNNETPAEESVDGDGENQISSKVDGDSDYDIVSPSEDGDDDAESGEFVPADGDDENDADADEEPTPDLCVNVTCPAAVNDCHEVGTCDPATGLCSNPSKVDWSPCDDRDACTEYDTCHDGNCMPGRDMVCPDADNNPCTKEECWEGSCLVSNDNEASCTDSDGCTLGDYCRDGFCNPGPPKNCDDGFQNTEDRCVQGECTHEFTPCLTVSDCQETECSWPTCGPIDEEGHNICTWNPMDGAGCEDGNLCTTNSTCRGGTCGMGTLRNCRAEARDPNNHCLDFVCDPTRGCVESFNSNQCEDGNPCTISDTCSLGVCVGVVAGCEDHDNCTSDSCDSQTGLCKHDPITCPTSGVCKRSACNADGSCGVEIDITNEWCPVLPEGWQDNPDIRCRCVSGQETTWVCDHVDSDHDTKEDNGDCDPFTYNPCQGRDDVECDDNCECVGNSSQTMSFDPERKHGDACFFLPNFGCPP